MSDAFWRDPPWVNGNGGYQMLLRPLAESNWCPRPINASETESKRQLLKRHFATTVQTLEGSENAQLKLSQAIGERHPIADTSNLELAATASRSERLIACALTVPEDLCLLLRGSDGYRLVAACVCAPSYWRLPEKIGLNLNQIHQPVAGLNAALGPRMDEFFDRLPAGRLFSRRNWLIHSSAERFQPEPEQSSGQQAEDRTRTLVMRSETQTVRRLSTDVVVFTISVECHPLTHISAYPLAANTLRQALLSRTAQERAAAGQDRYQDAVLKLLNRVEQEQ